MVEIFFFFSVLQIWKINTCNCTGTILQNTCLSGYHILVERDDFKICFFSSRQISFKAFCSKHQFKGIKKLKKRL